MKSKLAECNTFYWSKRYGVKCYCVGVANYLIDLQFEDTTRNGWYHCQEVEPLTDYFNDTIDISEIKIKRNNK